jgi:hypothetical protein
MKNKDEVKSVVVYSGSTWECEMVKSLLENEEIQAFLKDEYSGTIAPWVVAAGGAGSVKVVVSNLDFDRARAIVEEFEKNEKSS